MKKEAKRRRDSKMTARVTEDRQYRYFDRYLTDDHANRLVLVNVETKELKDLTPGYDRRFTIDGEVDYDVAPDGKSVAIGLNSTLRPTATSTTTTSTCCTPTAAARRRT